MSLLLITRRRRYRPRFFRIPEADTLAAWICLVSVFAIVFFGVTVRLPDGLAGDLVTDISASAHHHLIAIGIR